MRSALNVSPFCGMIGEALTSAPVETSVAMAVQVSVDGRLVCFARYSDSLCRTFSDTFLLYGRCFALQSVLTARVIVRNCVRGKKEPGFNSLAISITRFLHVVFSQCRTFSFPHVGIESSLRTHKKEGRLA